jgi:archaetidylinositol phosphate synthase
MFDQYLRPMVQRAFVDSLARGLHQRLDITPNLISIAGCLIGLLSAVAIGVRLPAVGLSLLLLSGIFDMLDGTYARLSSKTSDFGCALDLLFDRIVESAIVTALYFAHPEHPLLSLLMLGSILICVTSFLIVGTFTPNTSEKSLYYSPGLIERGEAFLFFALMILFPPYFAPLAAVFIFLVLFTAFVRMAQFYQVIRNA